MEAWTSYSKYLLVLHGGVHSFPGNNTSSFPLGTRSLLNLWNSSGADIIPLRVLLPHLLANHRDGM